MEQKQPSSLPRESLIYLMVCGLLTLAFLGLGVYPSKKSLDSLDVEIAKLEASIEEQKVLFPVYQSLLEQIRTKDPAKPSILRSGLHIDRIDEIPSIIAELTRKSNLELISAAPDVKSVGEATKTISVFITVRGGFFDFRKFLMALESLPSMEHTEEIQVQEASGGKEYRLKVWVTISGAKTDGKA